MTFSIITYDGPHSKTSEVLCGLYAMGQTVDELIALPFVQRVERDVLFDHRPNQLKAPHNREISAHYGIPYRRVELAEEINPLRGVVLICVGIILPSSIVESARVLNCHPGIIPLVRGLDAFKWAILEGAPLGNTLHALDANIDAGEVLMIWPTPVYSTDSIESLANRHYGLELLMCINCLNLVKSGYRPQEFSVGRPHRRMGKTDEQAMLNSFSSYRLKYAHSPQF